MDIIVINTKKSLLQVELVDRPYLEHLTSALLFLSKKLPYIQEAKIFFYDEEDKIAKVLGNNNDLLMLDAEVWFSVKALKKLFSLISGNKNAVKFVSGNGTNNFKNSKLDTQAIYFPSGLAGSLRNEIKISSDKGTFQSGKGLTGYLIFKSPELDDSEPPLRVKNMLDIALLEKKLFFLRACDAIRKGVRIRDPESIYIRGELKSGSNVEIDINVIIEGKVHLGNGVRIGANSILSNASIGADTQVKPFSIIEDAVIGSNSFIGPYGRVRPGSIIKDFVQIGNFVEIKNSEINSGSRINHLAFIGDSTLENNVTIGAGVITCNHNGYKVCQTHISKGAYIGSGTLLISPLSIGENAIIGAGSTITKNAPPGKLTLARSRQVTIDKRNKSFGDKATI